MDLPDAISTMHQSIVQIERTTDKAVLGTGFFVDAEFGFVVTAKHVADGLADGKAWVGMAMPNSNGVRAVFIGVEAQTLAEDTANDLAVLVLKNALFPRPAPTVFDEIKARAGFVTVNPAVVELEVNRPRDGDAIAVSGYPLSHPTLITNTGIVASAWATAADFLPTADRLAAEREAYDQDRFLIDASINPGNSGGPVYRVDNAAVIGVCVAYRTAPIQVAVHTKGDLPTSNPSPVQNSGIGVVVPAAYVASLITYTKAHLEGA